MDPAATLTHVRAHWASILPSSPIYSLFFAGIRIADARREDVGSESSSGGRILARLPVGGIHVNSKNILHGAVSAALVDWAGGMAIAAATGRSQTGVSVDIHISYVAAARVGDELEIEAWVQRVGGTLAYTSVEIRRRKLPPLPSNGDDSHDGSQDGDHKKVDPYAVAKTRGPVVARGSHTKYVAYGEPRKVPPAAETKPEAAETTETGEHRSRKRV
ncbi:thioesterase family protein [Sporothrix brasiliensis 5110]|uniref:Thioesterase family protein n=1 Tax=Sporothrix brasiliensis 5110 TaxID=1398154 RepID=A0A0C2FP34_9PEZI|nr:thioesterase family protein [Sporothrix brasiliensis 5110]KIH92808.1 thioesterase family protein [Sporothrix brasiliensis 5110]